MNEQHSAGSSTKVVDGWFRVEVTDRAGQVVAIEPNMLAGRDIEEAERLAINRAIRSLRSFAGFCEHDHLPEDCVYCEHAPTAGDFL